MKRTPLSLGELKLNLLDASFKRGALLCVGDAEHSNVMTISWGFTGVIWNQPMFVALVRPTRYSHEFLKTVKTFSVNFLSSRFSEQIAFCGTRTGRHVDKWQHCGFTRRSGQMIATPTIDEADLILECRIQHEQNLDPDGFMAKEIKSHYPINDYHTMYFGRIEYMEGKEEYAQVL
jgi:flavin reductase (DIM6/NTAB) family NADH-FMN oxidoreductase RutF